MYSEEINIKIKLPATVPRFFSDALVTDPLRLVRGDALAFLPSLATCSVDLIVTDPAYWSLEKHRNVGTTTRLGGGAGLADFEQEERGWFKTIDPSELFFCIREFGRVLRRDTHAWVMTDGTVLPYVSMIAEHLTDGAGRKVFEYVKPFPLLKRARNGNLTFGMGYHGRAAHEFAVLLKKGKRPMEGGRKVRDVLDHLWVGDDESKRFTPDGEEYPAAKPVSLYRQLLGFSARAGETILDPFGGSGPLIEAAAEMGCSAILCDRSERAIKTMQARALHAHAGASTPFGVAEATSAPAREDEPRTGRLF